MNIHNRHDHTETFYVFVSISQLSYRFRPANLIKLGIVPMINDSHLVGECIVYTDLCYRCKQMNGFIKLCRI